MKIAIIGGGPAGLYFARLMKRSRPADEVVVFEQNPRDATYGFGVTLGGPARERMRRIDEEVHDRLAAAMVMNNRQIIRLEDEDTLLEYASFGGAIARIDLLAILQSCCAEVGVLLHDKHRVSSSAQLSDFDLVVGADGVNSTLRSEHAAEFGTRSHYLGNRFAWYGVGREMNPNALVFRHALGGVFVAHYYAYSAGMSTFVAECDAATWQASGFAEMTDESRKAAVERIFARELEGHALVDNKSNWRRFNVVTNENWTHRNMVLLGDAYRSAHFSIGSGTRLAMDDAAELHAAFAEGDGQVAPSLARFVERRSPIRDQFGDAAQRSFMWYEAIAEKMRPPVIDFTYRFLTRTGRVDDLRLKDYAPGFHRQWQEHLGRVATAEAAI